MSAVAAAVSLPTPHPLGVHSSGAMAGVPSHMHVGNSSISHVDSGSAAAAQLRPQVYGGGRQGAKPYQEDSFFSWCSPTNRVIVGGIFGTIQRPTDRRKDAAGCPRDRHALTLPPPFDVRAYLLSDGHGGYNGLLASQTARDASLAYLQTNAHGPTLSRSAPVTAHDVQPAHRPDRATHARMLCRLRGVCMFRRV
jgi:hypothetical protein